LEKCGFSGFVMISKLLRSSFREIPEVPGIYCVLRPDLMAPRFRERSSGGHFKRKDPTVSVRVLEEKWVENSLFLYFGKAGGKGRATLRSRIEQYVRFGNGKPVAHWGGRYIWQMKDSQDLIICWKPTLDAVPRDIEKALISEFEKIHRRLPFANLRR